jgi:hypothetical protein
MWKLTLKVGHIISPLHKPSENTSVHGVSDKFALSMFQHSAPTLLANGGTYAHLKEMNIKNILPFAFPFGIGGPKMKRKVKVSNELCIQLNMKLSFWQFMEGPTILVMNHIYNRQMSYKSEVMICRSTVDGTPLGEKLSTLSMTDLEKSLIKNRSFECKYKRSVENHIYLMQSYGPY